MLEKKIMIDGKPVKFRASAAVPRLYMALTGSDIFSDIGDLTEQFHKPAETGEQQKAQIDLKDLGKMSTFENIAYVMAKHADPSIPDTPEEWLDGFNTFSIYQVLPQIIELWGLNTQTDVQAKKNFARLTGK